MAKEEYPIDLKVGIDLSDFSAKMREAGAEAKSAFSRVGKDVGVEKGFKNAEKTAGRFTRSLEGMRLKAMGVTEIFKLMPGSLGHAGGQIQKIGKAIGKLGPLGKVAIAGVIVAAIAMAIKKVYELSKSYGKAFDPVAVEKAESKFNQSMRRMKTSIGKVLQPVYETLSSVFSWIMDRISWTIEKIYTLVGFVKGFIGLGRSVNQTLSDTAEAMDEATEAASAGLSGWDKLNNIDLQDEGDLAQAQKIQQAMDDAYDSGQALRTSFSWFLGDFPKMFRDGLNNAWASIKRTGENVFNSVRSFGEGVWDGLTHAGESAYSVLTGAGQYLSTIGGTIASVFTSGLSVVGNMVGEMFDGVVKRFRMVFDGVVEGIKSALSGDLLGAFTSIFSGIWDAFADGFKGAANIIIKGFNTIIDAYNSTIGSIRVDNDTLGIHFGFPKMTSIPALANGGVAMPNNPYLAVVGDNRREPEVISPVSLIRQAVRDAISEAPVQNNQPKEIVLKLDGKTLARYTYSDIRAEGIRRGDW